MSLDTEPTTTKKYLQEAAPPIISQRTESLKDILVKAKLSSLYSLFIANCRSRGGPSTLLKRIKTTRVLCVLLRGLEPFVDY